MGRASIFHESVHALKDVKGWKVPSMQDEEVVAYLADAIYLRGKHTCRGAHSRWLKAHPAYQ
jgi:hypothetical protein